MLAELTVKEFLDKVAGSDPVPGGGSIAALNGAVASALTAMVAGLTVGKKGYEEHEELMKHISRLSIGQQELFVEYIDRDSEAYDRVFGCFKLPKTTDEEKAARSAAIQEATRFAALIPMQVARNACELMEIIADVARLGNRNAITDACVAMMVRPFGGIGGFAECPHQSGFAQRHSLCRRIEAGSLPSGAIGLYAGERIT